MSFLDVLRSWADLDSRPPDVTPIPTADLESTDPQIPAITPGASAFDRDQWRKKLKKILERLPTSDSGWNDLETEANALQLDTPWIERTYRDEFALLVRKIVSDRVVTPDEHHKLDLARTLMGIPDREAVEILRAIVKEAEQFFGKHVEGA